MLQAADVEVVYQSVASIQSQNMTERKYQNAHTTRKACSVGADENAD
jgi:hypothetical protein